MACIRPRTPPMLERSELSNYNMPGVTLPASKTSDETFSRFYGIFTDLIDSIVAINRNKTILEECQRKLFLLTLVITEKPDAEVKACLLNRLGRSCRMRIWQRVVVRSLSIFLSVDSW